MRVWPSFPLKHCSAWINCVYRFSSEIFFPVTAVVQPLSRARLFVAPWTVTHQASLSFTISWSLLKLMCIESVRPSNHLILCRPLLLLPSIFPCQFFASGGQCIGVSTSASVLPMNIQGWFPLGWSGLISLQSKGLSGVFSRTTAGKHQFFSAQLSSPIYPHSLTEYQFPFSHTSLTLLLCQHHTTSSITPLPPHSATGSRESPALVR